VAPFGGGFVAARLLSVLPPVLGHLLQLVVDGIGLTAFLWSLWPLQLWRLQGLVVPVEPHLQQQDGLRG